MSTKKKPTKKKAKPITKNQLLEKIKNLQVEIADKTKILDAVAKESFENGEHLKVQPFIPQYLGFEETVVDDKDDVTQARIYTKKGYNISQFVENSKPGWMILTPDKKAIYMIIENMYTAITVLRACGMPMSMKDYFEYNEKMEESMQRRFAETLEVIGEDRKAIPEKKVA